MPVATTDFFGREGELDKINSLLLGSTRLITLKGPGGIGKTRLAAEAVRRFSKVKNTPVYWVRLARLAKGSDTAAVEEEIARSVAEDDFSGRSAWEVLVETFSHIDAAGRERPTVLVLDNCEHVLTVVTRLVAELLEAVHGLRVIATSRDPLGWIDEHQIRVPPLPHRHAVALFRQRAELTGHPLTGQDHITAASDICRHIDHHPLYIQLAAARLCHRPVEMILRGLTGRADDTRLQWSANPLSGVDQRHRGVRDVIAWSYDLCTDEERLLFDRMSIFAAGYDVNPTGYDNRADALDTGADSEAIKAVCGDPDHGDRGVHLARNEIEFLLERLVDHSLVTMHITPTAVRYSLVESLRVFAHERLREHSTSRVDEPARLAERHLHYYHDKIIHAAANWFTPEGQHLLDWARASWDNILTAVETSLARPDQAAVGLEICQGLIALSIPFISGRLREIRQLTKRSLDAAQASVSRSANSRIEVMAALSRIAVMQGLRQEAEHMLEACITECVSDPDLRADWRRTAETDIGFPASVEFAWGMELLFIRRDARAIAVLARSRDKLHSSGDRGTASFSDLFATMAASLLGTAEQALQAIEHCRDRGDRSATPWEKAWTDLALSIALAKYGSAEEALARGQNSLTYFLTAGDHMGVWVVVESRSWTLARIVTDAIRAGTSDRAKLVSLSVEIAHLIGGAKTLRARLGIHIGKRGIFLEESKKSIEVARRVLGSDMFHAEESRGRRLRPETGEVQRLALGTLSENEIPTENDSAARSKSAIARWQQLSPAEHDVATLAAAGWGNTEIAARRGRSPRTIDAQIAAALQKLGITSRNDIIEYIPRNMIDTIRIEAATLRARKAVQLQKPR